MLSWVLVHERRTATLDTMHKVLYVHSASDCLTVSTVRVHSSMASAPINTLLYDGLLLAQ